MTEVFLLRRQNLLWFFQCVIYGLKVVGLAPFSLRIKTLTKNSSRVEIEFSKVGLSYNLLISILLPVTGAFVFRYVISMNYANKSTLTVAADTAQSIFVICTSFIVLISWTLKQRKAICIIGRLSEVDSRLLYSKIPPCYNKTCRFFIAHVVINNSLWFFIWAIKSFRNSTDVFPSSIFTFLPGIVICWYIVEYSTIIGLVTAELESINKNLLNLKEVRNDSPIDPLLNSSLQAFGLSVHSQLAVLQSLQGMRTTLSEISKEVAAFFSFPVLLCFAYSFSLLISVLYYIIIPVVTPNGTFTLVSYSSAVSWVIVTVHPIITLLFNVTETLNEAKRTGWIIHKLLASSRNPEITAKLEKFSLQLLHEDLNFTACGFFTLDFTLFHTMLGAAVTYLIILIQFQ